MACRGSREPRGSKFPHRQISGVPDSSRLARASWIEIALRRSGSQSHLVEARESLVDRNFEWTFSALFRQVEARESLVDRNCHDCPFGRLAGKSRLARASWIEIAVSGCGCSAVSGRGSREPRGSKSSNTVSRSSGIKCRGSREPRGSKCPVPRGSFC